MNLRRLTLLVTTAIISTTNLCASDVPVLETEIQTAKDVQQASVDLGRPGWFFAFSDFLEKYGNSCNVDDFKVIKQRIESYSSVGDFIADLSTLALAERVQILEPEDGVTTPMSKLMFMTEAQLNENLSKQIHILQKKMLQSVFDAEKEEAEGKLNFTLKVDEGLSPENPLDIYQLMCVNGLASGLKRLLEQYTIGWNYCDQDVLMQFSYLTNQAAVLKSLGQMAMAYTVYHLASDVNVQGYDFATTLRKSEQKLNEDFKFLLNFRQQQIMKALSQDAHKHMTHLMQEAMDDLGVDSNQSIEETQTAGVLAPVDAQEPEVTLKIPVDEKKLDEALDQSDDKGKQEEVAAEPEKKSGKGSFLKKLKEIGKKK